MAQISNNSPLFSCKKATELLDKESVLKLSFREKVALKIHIAICAACKRYKKQSQFLEKIFKSNSQKTDSDQVPQHTNEELKEKIFDYLEKNK